VQGTRWKVSGYSAIDTSGLQGNEKYTYFYVGDWTESAAQQTAGLNAELFNGKADISAVTGMVMPDYTSGTQWTSSVGSTWTATQDCVMLILLDQNSHISLYFNDINGTRLSYIYTPAACAVTQILPLSKGDVIYTERYSLSGSSKIMVFPLKGAQ
jgi:hypothetical protein